MAPVFAVLPDLRAGPAGLTGALYGALVYALSDYWLWTYHPAALIITCLYAAILMALLFPLMAVAGRSFPRTGYLSYPFFWLAYEYLRSQGFLGYPYGVLGYAFWRNSNILGLASVGGVWLVSLGALFVNALLGKALRVSLTGAAQARGRSIGISIAAALGIAAALFLAGGSLKTRYEPRGYLRVGLVQPSYRERQRSLRDYRALSGRLVDLTEEARKEHPDLILWHETAIVPPLGWHLRFRPDRETLDLVVRMDDYIRHLDVPLLLGNGRAEPDGPDPRVRKNWNSAFLFKDGQEIGRYDKTRLVPFSETFPMAKVFPKIAARIEAEVGQFWEKGQDLTIFHLDGVRFAAPICFEDSFGDHTRAFANEGADFLAVLTDDAWARSEACQYQHLAQSALRAAELGIPIVRAANTGATVLLGPDGAVLKEMPPFTEGVLLVEIPLPPERRRATLYQRFGDIVAYLGLGGACVWLIASIGLRIRATRALAKNLD